MLHRCLEQFLSQTSQIHTEHFEFDIFCDAKFSVVAYSLRPEKDLSEPQNNWLNQHQSTLTIFSSARRTVKHALFPTFRLQIFGCQRLDISICLNQTHFTDPSKVKASESQTRDASPFCAFSEAQEQALKGIKMSSVRTCDDLRHCFSLFQAAG